MKLENSFYRREDPVLVARSLLGKILHTNHNGIITAGKIVETEAYKGSIDRASHAYPGKRTERNAIMFEPGGLAYVYLIYGIYHLFNVVTNEADHADAVLIRALEPLKGKEIMMKRTGRKNLNRITAGPGLLSRAMGIDMSFYGSSMLGEKVWIEKGSWEPGEAEIVTTTRIGVDYAGDDSKLPWRFYIKNNPWVSKK